MTRSTRLIGLTVVGLGLSGLTFWQRNVIGELSETVRLNHLEISSLKNSVSTEQQMNTELRQANELLSAENQLLKDSIFWLNNHVHELNGKLAWHEATLRGIRAELSKKDRQLADLKKQLADLQAQNRPAVEQKKVEAAIAQTKKEQVQLDDLAKDETSKKVTTGKFLDENQNRINQYNEALELAKTTTVRFDNIELRQNKSGKPLVELAEDGKNWMFTDLEIEFSNLKSDLILEKKFFVRIIDMDSKRPLPKEETNPQFPNSENNTAGFEVKWEGKIFKTSYGSRAMKSGKNYELQVFYNFDGQMISMPQATKIIMRDGKAIN